MSFVSKITKTITSVAKEINHLSAIGLINDTLHLFDKTRDDNSDYFTNLRIQTSSYGKMIPINYGATRLGGNLIWAGEKRHSIEGASSISLAFALAEANESVSHGLMSVIANGEKLDLSLLSYRFYDGSETQMPDQAINNSCAYRGICYIVLENFSLSQYNNRLPTFAFDIFSKLVTTEQSNNSLEQMVKSLIIIPASGEFVYDTIVQYKKSHKVGMPDILTPINMNNNKYKADALLSLDQMNQDLPAVEWVAPVVAWFADSLQAGSCKILPGAEFDSSGGVTTSGEQWSVAGYNRDSAYQITRDGGGNLNYGGTVNDLSVLRYLDELRNNGKKIMFYPIIFVDQLNKPWRGRIMASNTNDITGFFENYTTFILHYANLVKNKVDGFIIGSELIGLTKFSEVGGKFPAVDCLVELASKVKAIVGQNTVVTYAADWSEYHHSDGGWFNLDPLWASADIDVVGIDAYFPLTEQLGIASEAAVIDGFTSGEGYDFYYVNGKGSAKAVLSPDYAWKNIDHWWSNLHRNPDGSTTSWIPKMKKIWFTEFGFPSVDGSSNQPNVFYDPKSSEGGLPYLSQGVRSNQAQRIGISATLKKWASSPMIERMFLWTWDARPYPYYPNRNNIWGDGALWPMGHFVGGKLGQNLLGDVINDLCKRSGIHQEYVNSISLDQAVTGITLINKPKSVREILRELATGYFFHIVENGDGLSFFSNPDPARSRWQKSAATIIRYDDLIDANVSRNSLIDRSALQIIYTDYNNEYKVSNCYAGAVNGGNMLKLTMPMTLDQDSAITIAKRIFSNIISGRDLIEMTLPETFYRNNIRIGNLVRLDWIDRRCFIIQSAIIDSSNRIKIVVQSIG